MSINPLAPRPENLPAELLDMMAADAGKGVSFEAADQMVPRLYVAQSNSPAVDKRGEDYVDGCEAGDFVLRVGGVSTPRNGRDGILTIPAGMQNSWVVFRAQRQGFLARYLQKPAGLIEVKERNENGREQLVLKLDDDVVVPSRDLFLLVADEQGSWSPFVMFCTSTFHTFAREWNTYQRSLRHPKTGQVMPSYGHLYRLTTTIKHNALGRWFIPKYEDLGVLGDIPAYNLARELHLVVGSPDDVTRPAA